jgi:hypothetical protein
LEISSKPLLVFLEAHWFSAAELHKGLDEVNEENHEKEGV